jgi:AcrR family transcriptional regulator
MSWSSEYESSFIARTREQMSVQERHRRERHARGQAILAAAAKVFARHGLEGATVEMVAREAEVAVGTIYLYYSSRDDLYLNLISNREEHLRARYLDIFARRLEPLDELKTIASAYLDYLRESREIFLSQHSVVFSQLHQRLKRNTEKRNFQRVMDLSHEIFGLWEGTIRRAFEGGVIANSMGPKKTAAVVWASMNGAFMLMGDGNFFRDVTGLNPEHFLDEALESHLAASQLSVRRKKSEGRIVNRARKMRAKVPLTRALGAASPATKRARRVIGGAERDTLTWPSPSSSPLQGEGKRRISAEANLEEVGVHPSA